MSGQAPRRPALRWHGGKWRLAPWIISHFPPHRTYVEPFGGAASVLLRKERSRSEVYNDLDDSVVNLFRVLRGPQSAELVSAVALTPFSRSEFEQAYEPADDPLESARRLIVRSFMGFGSNGHQRRTGFRSKGYRAGRLPQHDWAGYPDALMRIIDRLSDVVIENDRAAAVIERYDDPETLFYVDPPYLPEVRDRGSDYAHEMGVREHEALLDLLCSAAGHVVISGYPCGLYDEALRGWRRVEITACADRALERTEVLWINPRACAAQDALRFPLLKSAVMVAGRDA